MNKNVQQLIAIASNARLKHAFIHDTKALAKLKTEFNEHKALLLANDGEEFSCATDAENTHKVAMFANDGEEFSCSADAEKTHKVMMFANDGEDFSLHC